MCVLEWMSYLVLRNKGLSVLDVRLHLSLSVLCERLGFQLVVQAYIHCRLMEKFVLTKAAFI